MRAPRPGFESAIVNLYRAMAEYADAHRKQYELTISEDRYIGDAWHQIGRGLIGLLNGETGRLDCGTLDSQIRAFLGEGGSPESTEAVRAQTAPNAPRARRGSSKSAKSTPDHNRRLSERQRELLNNLRVEDNVAVYVPEERIADWAELKQVMLILGGKWQTGGRKKKGGFHFAENVDARELVRLALESGEVLDPKLAGFFPTPVALAKQLVKWAEIEPGMRVLEPSAGTGAIALAAREAGAEVCCIEVLNKNCAVLTNLGLPVRCEDFLEASLGHAVPFDRVVANPPFANQQDIAHVLHAFEFLKPGGILVSIMSSGVQYRSDRCTREFREFVQRNNGEIIQNPDGSFAESGTMVRTVMVKVRKAA